MKRTTARGRGQSNSPLTPLHPKPPVKGYHPTCRHSRRTKSCHSQPRRDTDRDEWKGRANALSVVMARHAGIEPTGELAKHRLLDSSAVLFCPAGPWEEENGRARGRSRSLKRKLSASAERQDWSTRSASIQPSWAWDFSKHDTHSAWVSLACRGFLHVLHLQQRCAEICSFSKAFLDLTRLWQGMTESASWALQEVQSSRWGTSMADPDVSEESAKKGLCRWREEIWVAVAEQLII